MFPNVRLLIAALLASVFVLSCGFGMFAALRVNREPLGRLPASTTALQLVASEATAAPATWGVPYGPGLRVSDARTGAVATDALPAGARASSETNSSPIAANPWTAGTIKPEASNASPSVQPSSVSTTAPAPQLPPPISNPTSPAIPTAATDITPTSATQLALTASAPGQETPQGLQPAPATTVAAIEPTANATPSGAQPSDVTGTVPNAATPGVKAPENLTRTPERKATRKVARKPIERRVVKKRVVRPGSSTADARSTTGTSTFDEPVFRSAPLSFERSPATNRRALKKTAKNTAPTNPPVLPTTR